uniref:Putative rna-binding protein 48 n=1 Tax=Culex tarsalis TaxID=7177 RepID=A0A1Q3F253_CULTA
MTSDPERNPTSIDLSHHVRYEYCHNRPAYRASRKQTAVKAYSVASESRHLLVFGVPQIDLVRELKVELRRYGTVQLVQNVTEAVKATGSVDIEPFTDVFHVQFEKLDRARRAKKLLDAKNFYGGILHLSYAPERESVEELRQKLAQRRREIAFRVPKQQKSTVDANEPAAKRVKKF